MPEGIILVAKVCGIVCISWCVLCLFGQPLLRHLSQIRQLPVPTRCALSALLLVSVLFAQKPNGESTNESPDGVAASCGLRGGLPSRFYGPSDILARLSYPTNLVVTNLVCYGLQAEEGNVAIGFVWPEGDAYASMSDISVYGNWTLGGGPWVWAGYVATRANYCSNAAGEIDWQGAFDAAVSDGLFPTNASSNTCFLRGVWCIDTDGDGLEDGDELYVYLTDPHNPDTDGDGLTDCDELFYMGGTDPFDPDTDGDGLTDGWEWWYWMNPCVWNDPNVDPDEDGLSNIEECQYGTDPFNDDSDSDGMPDLWEIAMGIDPSSRIGDNGHDADPDHDGLTNYEEYCRGTNPLSADCDNDGLIDSLDPHPFVSDGDCFGQGDGWVVATFANASEILPLGYANWVDREVGQGLQNGYYKLIVTVTNALSNPSCLTVGSRHVVVTNAGDYVFLLGKGIRYGLDVWPDPSVAAFVALDDIGAQYSRGLQRTSTTVSGGSWSEDGGSLTLITPSTGTMGCVLWMPRLSVSPVNWSPSQGDPSETFTAVLSDYSPLLLSPSYAWSSENSSASIASPASVTTLMTARQDMVPMTDVSARLTVSFGGEQLQSEFIFRENGTEDPCNIAIDFPDTLFLDDDDDDNDGIPDYGVRLDQNDDIGEGRIVFSSPESVSGTISVERIAGSASEVYCDESCSVQLREGMTWDLDRRSFWSLPIRVVAFGKSRTYESEEIKFRWQPDGGLAQTAVCRYTVVSPVAEPICTEWTTNGSRRRVVNPCGVAVGSDAVFKAQVEPRGYPSSKIVWRTSGSGVVAFPNGNTGREVRVRGVSAGFVQLKAQIGSCAASPPTFGVHVVEPRNVRLSAWIVADKNGTQTRSVESVREMINGANDILAQVGVTLYVGNRIVVTNVPAAYNILWSGTTNTMMNFDQLVNMNLATHGLECYFVNAIFKESDNGRWNINGGNSTSGIVISSLGNARTLAHEVGHAFGMSDIYGETESGREYIGFTHSDWMPEDWNGGCDGHGEAGTRYYPCRQFHRDVIRKMLMNGRRNSEDNGCDITSGYVRGLDTSDEDGDQPVGFYGVGGGSHIPEHR